MDTVTGADGRKRFILGPVEAGVMTAIPIALVSVCVWVASGAFARLDKLSDNYAEQNGRLEAMTVQLTAMNATLAGVPQLATQYAELKVRVDNNERHITEIRSMRGLR